MKLKLYYGPADGLELNVFRKPQVFVFRIYDGQIVMDDNSLEAPKVKYYYRRTQGNHYHLDEIQCSKQQSK